MNANANTVETDMMASVKQQLLEAANAVVPKITPAEAMRICDWLRP